MADWTWDENKSRSNLAKHGIDFGVAQLIFRDALSTSRLDRNSPEEERWQTIGQVGTTSSLSFTRHRMVHVRAALSVLGQHRAGKGKHMSKVTSDQLTPKQRKMLAKIATVKDDDIDFSDIPEQLDWKDAKRGVFYKPVKQQLTLRLDADVVDWFKQQGAGYQTKINAVLRKHVGRKAG